MKKAVAFAIILLVEIILQSKMLTAQIPRQINYQGYLTNSVGQAITDTLTICFSIYADQNKRNPLWSEDQQVIVNRGLYNVILGLKNPISDSIFSGGIRYLGLRIGNNPDELAPLTPILSVGYAFTADKARYADSTRTVNYADSASKANIADSVKNIAIAKYADSSRIAFYADSASCASWARISDQSKFVEKSGYSENAKKSNRADTAQCALYADSSKAAGKVTYADSSRISSTAYTASSANYAITAQFAEKAGSVEIVKKATLADTANWATKAGSVDFAEKVGYADSSKIALNAHFAFFSSKAESAKYVSNVCYSDSSMKSFHAHISDSSATSAIATRAELAFEAKTTAIAETAKHALMADEATKAESATDAEHAQNSDMLDGKQASYFAIKDHTHDGRYYTIEQSINSDSNSIDAKRVGGKEVGNQYSNIPINNGKLNQGLNASKLKDYEPGNLEGNIPLNNGIKNINLNSDILDNFHVGNNFNQIPINNNQLNLKLNADLLDGLNAAAFVDSQFKTYLKSPGNLSAPNNPVHWTKLKDVPIPLANITLEGFSGGGIAGSLSIRKSPMSFTSENVADSNAIFVESNPVVGLRIKNALQDGISIDGAARNAITIKSSDYGINIQSAQSYGIFLAKTVSDAIRINSTGDGGCGVYINQAGSNGINIDGAKQYGIRAKGNMGGGKFETANNPNAYALIATASSDNAKALLVQGTSKFESWAASDSGFVSKLARNSTLYAVNCLDLEVTASGRDSLINGKATVKFEDSYSKLISPNFPLNVLITASEPAAGLLYVTNKSPEGFVVNLQTIPGLENYKKNVHFDWLAIGRVRDFEIRRNVINND